MLPRVVPGGLPFPRPPLTCHLPVSGAEAPGCQGRAACGVVAGGGRAPRRNHSGRPSASRPPSAEPFAQRPRHHAGSGGELARLRLTGGLGLFLRAVAQAPRGQRRGTVRAGPVPSFAGCRKNYSTWAREKEAL